VSPIEHNQRKHKAKTLVEVLQRSSSKVEGRNGSLALRHHHLRGLDRPRKRAGLIAVHHFLLVRPDGTTAAERFCGQKPYSMFTAILGSVESPLLPSVRCDEPWDRLKGCRVADAVIKAPNYTTKLTK
jgi:hypothetical protein